MTSFLNSIGKKKNSLEQLILSTKQSILAINTKDDNNHDNYNSNYENNDMSNANNTILFDRKMKNIENIHNSLLEIKNILMNHEINEEKVINISKYIQNEQLIDIIIENMSFLSLDGKKDNTIIINCLIRKNIDNFHLYILKSSKIIDLLLEAYPKIDCIVSCGIMLREMARHEQLMKVILYSDRIWKLFTLLVETNISTEFTTDAFSTLKDFLTTPKVSKLSIEFLQNNGLKVLDKFNILIESESIITRRRALKLLSELLLDHNRFSLMMIYIASKENLKRIMKLLRHNSTPIQLEAFHIFKIFVANPTKTKDVEQILNKNKQKLITYLESFHLDHDDPLFVDEKRLLIDTLSQMKDYSIESLLQLGDNNVVNDAEKVGSNCSEKLVTLTVDAPGIEAMSGLTIPIVTSSGDMLVTPTPLSQSVTISKEVMNSIANTCTTATTVTTVEDTTIATMVSTLNTSDTTTDYCCTSDDCDLQSPSPSNNINNIIQDQCSGNKNSSFITTADSYKDSDDIISTSASNPTQIIISSQIPLVPTRIKEEEEEEGTVVTSSAL